MLKFSNILDATIFLSTCLQAVITKGTCLTISLSCFSPHKLVCVCFGLATQSSIIIKSGGCSKNYKILYGLFVLWAGMIFTQNFLLKEVLLLFIWFISDVGY